MRYYLFIVLIIISITHRIADSRAQSSSSLFFPPDGITVTILHSNDVYGQLTRRSRSENLVGGMPSRVNLIRQAQKDGPVITLDAGNAFGPAPLSASDQGATMINLMHLAGYTAMLPANHDFNFGLEALRQRRAEAGFPFLGTNLTTTEEADSLLQSYLIIDTKGPRIGIIGLLSQEIPMLTNPKYFEHITITDPVKTAKSVIDTLQNHGVDYVVALTHMREANTLALAREVEGIDLIIAGGYLDINLPEHVPSVIRLVDGTEVVTTPGYGGYLGQVTIQFVRHDHTSYRPIDTTTRLLPVNASVPADSAASNMLTLLQKRYREAFSDTLGIIVENTREDQARLVASLMQTYTDTELGILNQGIIQKVSAGVPLMRQDLDRFIRFPNTMVTLELMGSQIRKIVARSQQVSRNSARLVFTGLDPATMMIEGRQLQNGERYKVVTTDFLFNGGDGYGTFTQGTLLSETGITLQSLVQESLEENSTLTLKSFQTGHHGIWQSGWEVEGAFERNFVDDTTEKYREQNETVSFLSGATTVAWNSAMRYFLSYEIGPHTFSYFNSMDFGQIGNSLGDLTPSSDQIELELRYRFRPSRGQFDPFVSAGINTAFTSTNGQRPLLNRYSIGFQRQFFNRLVTRLAVRVQRDYVVDENDIGTELALELTQPLQNGARLTSQVRSFAGVTDRRVISVENYNTLSFPLLGTLRLNVRQNNFVYRVNRIRGVPVSGIAFRTNVTVGFAYGLNWKWL